MRLAVVGGAGFIGSNYVRRVLDGSLQGIDDLVVIDKLTYAGTLSNFSESELTQLKFIRGDICNKDFLMNSLVNVDAMINFAAESHVDNSIKSAEAFVTTNILGTQNLLDVCRHLEINNYVQVSTDEVYGSISSGSWNEDEPLQPNSPYSASKASADLLVRAANKTHNLGTKITRCSNNYGPHQFPEKIIPLFVTNLILGKKIPIYGTGDNVRDWLHVDDHCFGIHLVLQHGQSGAIYNIGGGKELSNLELTSIILDKMGKSFDEVNFVPDRKAHDHRYSVDFRKIHKELGYFPKIDFFDGIDATISWYVNNDKWWSELRKQD